MDVWTLEGLMMLTGIFLVGPIGLSLLLSWLLKRLFLAKKIVLGLFALYFLALGSFDCLAACCTQRTPLAWDVRCARGQRPDCEKATGQPIAL